MKPLRDALPTFSIVKRNPRQVVTSAIVAANLIPLPFLSTLSANACSLWLELRFNNKQDGNKIHLFGVTSGLRIGMITARSIDQLHFDVEPLTIESFLVILEGLGVTMTFLTMTFPGAILFL